MEKTLNDPMYVMPMGTDIVVATFAVLFGQNDIQIWDMPAIADTLTDLVNTEQGTVAFGDHVVITWQIDCENYICENGTYYRKDKETDSWFWYRYTITIQ